MLLSYFLMFISFFLLLINGAQGYLQFKIYNATHIQFAFISTIFYMFSESWIMFYFIGSGKTIKEIILENNFDKNIYQRVINSKKSLFPHITFNILFVGTVFVLGGAVHTGLIPRAVHGILFILSMFHFLYLINLQHKNFICTANILSELGEKLKGSE